MTRDEFFQRIVIAFASNPETHFMPVDKTIEAAERITKHVEKATHFDKPDEQEAESK